MCEGSFLPSSFGPHQKHTEFESSLRSYPINPSRGSKGGLQKLDDRLCLADYPQRGTALLIHQHVPAFVVGVIPKTAPRPLIQLEHQSALHRIPVHVAYLFYPIVLTPHHEI